MHRPSSPGPRVQGLAVVKRLHDGQQVPRWFRRDCRKKGSSVMVGPEQAIEHFGLFAGDVRKDEIDKKKGSTQTSLFVAVRWFVFGHPLPSIICLKSV
eukprot:5078462-Pyramimonas_sp.AAC.1